MIEHVFYGGTTALAREGCRYSITAKLTDDLPDQPRAADPLASQRAELLGQLVLAQFDLEQAASDLARSGAGSATAEIQLQNLSALMRQVGTANPAKLSALRGEIGAAVAQSATVVQQTRAASSNGAAEDLLTTTVRTRATVSRVADELFERRLLDPYLRFGSAEDEAEYRKREAEREAYVRTEIGKGTPEGARNAAQATLAQIDDAGAHGADRSPDFDRLRGETVGAINEQRVAEQRAAIPDRNANQHAQMHFKVEPESAEPSSLDDIAAALRAAGVTVPSTEQMPANVHNGKGSASVNAEVQVR